ncbi:NADPH-dependent FMN reductase [Polaromonas glacialis]|uniref:NADPH-dependent FMN reductase n=1 Tax=Polaromonas glacialis TaxID=866564 RepID=UPI000496FC1C|nr:NADPH-dependent FMN reductase [Polaromonas glacialis]
MSVASTVLLIAGSPSESSRSAALLDSVSLRLARSGGLKVERLNIRELPAQALLLAEWGDPEIVKALAQVQRARAIVVATPVYKAAYSGVLKVFLDLLPQTALKEKTVLPLATGGSPHHMLALDYALRPVLQSLSARHILPGVYATDAQIARSADGRYTLDADIATRLDEAVATLLAEGFRMPQPTRFDPVLFSQVRCSV